MNMIDIQDKLKNLSEDQLIKEMQMPSGQAPQFLVLSEITRRKKMRDGMKAAEAKQGVPSVAEEVVAAAAVPQQGLPQMASAMAPKSSIEQNTGIASLPVQRMASGGLVQKMAEGGRVVVRNGKRFIEQEDGTLVPETRAMSMFENLRQAPSEIAAIPAQLGAAARDFSAGFAGQMNADLARSGDEAMRRQMAEDAYGMRAGPDTSYQYPPMPMVDTAPMDQVAMALEGRSGFPTGMPTPQQLAMAAAQPQLPPAPLPAFGPGFEYGGRGPAVDLDLVAPEVQPGPSFENVGREIGAASPLDMANTAAAMGADEAERQALLDRTAATMRQLEAERAPKPAPSGRQQAYEAGREADAYDPLAAIVDAPMTALGDVGGMLAGRTVEEQRAIDAARREAASPGMTTGTPLTVEDLQGDTEEEEGLMPPDATEDGMGSPSVTLSSTQGGGGTGGGGGGSGGASGQGGFISELESALARAERTKEQDKWLALAQAGLALMASDQPTLGGAVGEAGQVGIEAFRGARDTYEQSRMSILEAIASQRAAAARAAGGGRGSKPATIDDYLRSLEGDLSGIMTEVEDPITGAKVLQPRRGFEDVAAELMAQQDAALRKKYGIGAFDATQ